ncbi:MAG: HEPN domain-containing protein [Saprospiraceae bacterium]|nr:MAG: HEPN domain-containing protein [Saprospiraceae bacterium]
MEEVKKLIGEAEIQLEEPRTLLEKDFYRGTINRPYYAMYTCTMALMMLENIQTKTHAGILAKFHEVFIKTGKLPLGLGSMLHDAFNKRQRADYNFDFDVDKQTAEMAFENAGKFVANIKSYISQQS